ncbi:unnamed protein product [Moneuplotes crassus]|uniref:Uncharacterized protein n=1 Tax=Euplotes crassus TaxID=5936 RepID=A0AAD1UMV5_EUPCR|nr:unnamed protein product [Moneuplotes crassus]
MITSQGDEFKDPGIYVGTGGLLLYFYKKIKYLQMMREDLEETKESFDICFETNLELWKHQKMSKKQIPSFFMGMPGILTIGYLFYHEFGNESRAYECLSHICNYAEMPLEESEILYGHAGLLYCLLLIKDNNPECAKVDKYIFQVTLELIQHGIDNFDELGVDQDKKTLYYDFPHRQGANYLGAAHGVMGIVYLVLKAFEFIPLQDIPQACFRVIKNTCNEIAGMQTEEGNFPMARESLVSDLVHFCHGAPGAIPFLLKCHEFYEDKKFLIAALKAGELVITKGILKKGNNLCHGISGNVYCLMNIYSHLREMYEGEGDPDADKDILKWKINAYKIAHATYIKNIQIRCVKYRDPTRKVRGIPDTVYSLMEGRMGCAVMYLDILTNEHNMKFPGYEI